MKDDGIPIEHNNITLSLTIFLKRFDYYNLVYYHE